MNLRAVGSSPVDLPFLDNFPFTARSEVLATLRERRRDAGLLARIRKDQGAPADAFIKKLARPRAIIFRQLATPTHEIQRFLRLAKAMKLAPLILEYHGDKFVSAGNSYKRALGKLPLYQYTGSDGRDMVRYRTIIDFNQYVGKQISDVVARDGETLIDLHHRMLEGVLKVRTSTLCFDATAWFRAHGDSAALYYEPLLTFMIRDAVLFEHFEPTESESEFVRSIFLPAMHAVEVRYGVRPLIMQLVPKEESTRNFWGTYPKKIERYF